MGDFPASNAVLVPGPVISTGSPEAAASDIAINTGLTAASAVWPSANRTIQVPIALERITTIRQMYAYNGTVVSGNADVGIYDYVGNLLVSMGATAQAGTSVIQTFNIADTTLAAGIYFLALALSNTTGTFFRIAMQTQQLKFAAVYQDSSVMPSTMSFTDASSAYLPVFGAVAVSTI